MPTTTAAAFNVNTRPAEFEGWLRDQANRPGLTGETARKFIAGEYALVQSFRILNYAHIVGPPEVKYMHPDNASAILALTNRHDGYGSTSRDFAARIEQGTVILDPWQTRDERAIARFREAAERPDPS